MFCKFCGKELQDGEVCGCAGSQQAAAAQAQQTSGAAQAATDQMSSQVNAGQADAAGAQGTQFNTAQMQQKANEYMQQGMEAAGNAWKNLLGIFKSPAQEGRAYVAESDMTVSLILIVLQAVIAGLFGLICTTRINAAFSGITSYFSSNKYQVSNAKGFFVTLIFSVVLSAVFALIFFAAGKIVKADIDYKKALAITSVRSAAVIPFMPISDRYKIEVFIASSLGVILLLALIGYLFYLYWREARRRKEVLANLKQEKEHLSLALEGGNIFAWELQSGTFRFDNEFFSYVNTSPREIPLDELYEMVHPDDRQSLRSLIDFICTGTISHHILQYRCDFNGKGYQWWEFRYGSLEDANDGYVINGLCLNIQNIKDTEEVLISAREKAEESDRMKSAFLANMSHEIRTPLNAIVGFSNLMNSEEVLEPEEREQFVKLINTNSDLLLKLINDILDLSRMESGKMSFVFDRHDLNVLINEIYCTFQLMIPEGVELRMRVPEIPVVVAVDPYRLKQVLSNFINNAIKFTTSGYIEVGYYFCTKGDCLHIYVEDTGIGIPEEKQKQVFDRFCKLDEFAQGTGLGLAICQVIAQRFGGEIQLKSEYGKGSRFTLTLPKERIG